ncbi:unnamed protein product [Closterium sp. Naga37s-1]|nr:unnamed protein product [Closterium sp. Naga37s-1]
MFAKFGDVSRVIVEGDDTDGSSMAAFAARLHHSSSAPSAAPSAVVVFARPESLRRLLKTASLSASSKASLKAKAQAKATITDPDPPMQGGEADGDGEGKGKGQAEGEEAQQPLWPAWGMEGWLNAYADERPGLAHLQAEADAYISEYEDRLERERREAEERALRSQEDDGWTVVRSSSASRRNRDPSSGVSMGVISKARAQVLAVKLQQKQKKQQAAAAEALKFYRFQHREARRQGQDDKNSQSQNHASNPLKLETDRLENELKAKSLELEKIAAEAKGLKLLNKSMEKAVNGTLELKKANDLRKASQAAQQAAEATVRRLQAAQKGKQGPALDEVIAALEAELKLSQKEDRLMRTKEVALLDAEKAVEAANAKAAQVDECMNKIAELTRQLNAQQDENKTLDRMYKQKVDDVKKLTSQVESLSEAVTAAQSYTSVIKDYQRQLQELQATHKITLDELARAKIAATRVASAVANEWKDDNDKVIPVKQWLEERRVMVGEAEKLKEKLAHAERATKYEAQMKVWRVVKATKKNTSELDANKEVTKFINAANESRAAAVAARDGAPLTLVKAPPPDPADAEGKKGASKGKVLMGKVKPAGKKK